MHTYDAPLTRSNSNLRTWFALLFVMLVFLPIRLIVHSISPTVTTQTAILREGLILASAALLLVYIRRVEGMSLRSVGLGTSVWWKSVLWGLVTMVLCGAAAFA